MSSFYDTAPVLKWERAVIDAAKGLLILSIMIGHMRFMTGSSPLYSFVYGYHVMGFLMLPFLYPIADFNKETLCKYLARYGLPFLIFFFLFAALNITVLEQESKVQDLFLGLILNTPEMLDQAVGTSILWFLPALILMLTLLMVAKRWGVSFVLLLAAGFVFHVSMGLIPRELAFSIPFSAVNVFYIFFLGVVLRALFIHCDKMPPYLALVGFIIGQAIILPMGEDVDVSGFHLADMSQPFRLVVTDIIVLSAMIFLCTTEVLKKSRVLVWLGQNSLPLFLFHQPIMAGFWKVYTSVFGVPETKTFLAFAIGAAILLVSVLLSSLMIGVVKRIPRLQTFVFPRGFQAWKAAVTK